MKECMMRECVAILKKKWEQYSIITNNEDAWSFKEWLIKQYKGGNK